MTNEEKRVTKPRPLTDAFMASLPESIQKLLPKKDDLYEIFPEDIGVCNAEFPDRVVLCGFDLEGGEDSKGNKLAKLVFTLGGVGIMYVPIAALRFLFEDETVSLTEKERPQLSMRSVEKPDIMLMMRNQMRRFVASRGKMKFHFSRARKEREREGSQRPKYPRWNVED